MSLSTKPYKGTRDFFPEQMKFRRSLQEKFSEILSLYGFQEYDGPMIESFDLYAAKTGEEIVQTQLYHFEDRGGRKVAIRPEMTPTLARMVASKLEELPKPIRWFSFPNLWRYERPQRGRLREHWQLNADIMGGEHPESEIEILCVAAELFAAYKALAFVKFKINHRQYVDYVFSKVMMLNADQSLALIKLFDAKDKMPFEKYEESLSQISSQPEFKGLCESYLNSSIEESLSKFPCEELKQIADIMKGVNALFGENVAVFDPSIMRGLDYYTGMVFEAFDVSSENPRALLGGGRYDNLVGLFNPKKQISGVGFGMGDVVFSQFLETHELSPKLSQNIDIYLSFQKAGYSQEVRKIAEHLRKQYGLSCVVSHEEQKIKAILKLADKLNSQAALWFSEDEFKRSTFLFKSLDNRDQLEVPINNYQTNNEFLSVLQKLKNS